MSCGCTSSYDGTSDVSRRSNLDNLSGGMGDASSTIGRLENQSLENEFDDFQGEAPAFVPDLNFTDLDNVDDGRMDFRFNDDGEEFDDFLTKRSRARLKRRKALRKEGLSRKEASAQAKSEIPKQKLGSLIRNIFKGKTSPETKKAIASAGAGKQTIAVPPVENDESMGGTKSVDATMGMGMGADTTMGMGADATKLGFVAKNKTMLLIAGAGALVVGGYFLFGKKLGIRG